MTQMKLLELLLDYLPDDYVDCVVNNLDDRSVLEDDAYSIESEMMALFDWHNSTEGYDFWNDVFHYILGNGELPPLPIKIDYKPSCIVYVEEAMYMMNVANTGIHLKMDVDLKEMSKATNKNTSEIVYSWLN